MLRRGRSDEGQVAIEMAFVLPLLLAFIMFLLDLALFGFSYVSVTNAVREGARCGAVGASPAAIEARVNNTSGISGDVNAVNVAQGSDVGDDVSVSATYDYSFITPVGLVPGVSGTLSFTKTSVMRLETGPPFDGGCG